METTTRSRRIIAAAVVLAIAGVAVLAIALTRDVPPGRQVLPAPTELCTPELIAARASCQTDTTAPTPTTTGAATTTGSPSSDTEQATTSTAVTSTNTAPVETVPAGQDGPPPACDRVWQAGLPTPTPGYRCQLPDGNLYTSPTAICRDSATLVTGQVATTPNLLQGRNTPGAYLTAVTPDQAADTFAACDPDPSTITRGSVTPA